MNHPLFLLLLTAWSPLANAQEITITLDGEPNWAQSWSQPPQVAAKVIDGKVYVSATEFAQLFGGETLFNPQTQVLTVNNPTQIWLSDSRLWQGGWQTKAGATLRFTEDGKVYRDGRYKELALVQENEIFWRDYPQSKPLFSEPVLIFKSANRQISGENYAFYRISSDGQTLELHYFAPQDIENQSFKILAVEKYRGGAAMKH